MRTLKTLALSGIAVLAMTATSAQAQDLVMGDIIPVGENFCPRATMEAAGQLLPISQYDALFSLFGTMYGGDGRTTFALPDLRGRMPDGQGRGPGLSDFPQGARGGRESVTLTVSNLPAHNHPFNARSGLPATGNPSNTQLADFGSTTPIYSMSGTPQPMAQGSIGAAGGNLSTNIMNPYIVLRFCVVVYGIYPSRG